MKKLEYILNSPQSPHRCTIFEMSISAKSLDLRKLLNFVLGFSLKFFFPETKHIFIKPQATGCEMGFFDVCTLYDVCQKLGKWTIGSERVTDV